HAPNTIKLNVVLYPNRVLDFEIKYDAESTPNQYVLLRNISPLNVTTRTNGATLFVTIGNDDRFVPPVDFPNKPTTSTESLSFKTTVIPGSDIFAFQVIRQSTGTILWDTSIGGMQFADKFIQIATNLPSRNIFGFGEHIHQRLRHDLSRYTVWPMFARDIGPDSSSPLSTQNLYVVISILYFVSVENDSKAHGVLILNSNAQEVVTGPGPHLIYRTIGGRLDLAFFPGPTPEEVVQQYLAYIGHPFLPAYWALGYQLSRWGYANLDAMKAVVARVQAAGVPLDVAYADIDYMNRYRDFTEGPDWAGFGAYVDDLHKNGLHLILIFDPAIEADYASFQRARDPGLFLKNASFIEWADKSQVPTSLQNQYPMVADSLIMLGNVWPDNNTAMPDFLDPTNNTLRWWISEYQLFHKTVGFDGVWIDMNEPSNFDTDTYSGQPTSNNRRLACPITGPGSEFDNPPYQTYAVYNRPGEHLCSKTLCMLGKTGRRTMDFYNTKNLYGMSEAKATIQALSATTGKRGAIISRSTFPSSGRYGGVWLGDNTATWKDLQTSVIGVMEFNFFGLPYVGSDICGFNGITTEELCLRWHQMGAFHPFCRNHNAEFLPAQDPAVWPSVAKAARIALGFRYKYLPYLYSLLYAAALDGHTVIRPLFFEYPTDFIAMEIDHQFLWGSAIMVAPALEKGGLYWDAGDDLYDSIDTHKRHHWSFMFSSDSSTSTLRGKCDGCDPSVQNYKNHWDVIEILGYDFYPSFASFTLNGVKVNIDTQSSSYMALSRRLYISTKNLINLSTTQDFQLSWSHQPVNEDS
ncbi:glycosyl hydrolase, family 31, partial [Cooperia oncophora]